MTAKVLQFPVRPRPASPPLPDAALVLVDRDLAEIEEQLDRMRGWLPRLKGWVREQAALELAALEARVGSLSVQRLRLAGPELALLPGGKL